MRFLRNLLIVGVFLLFAIPGIAPISAQPPDTATPAPVEHALDGRLGGSLDSFTDRFGTPDFTGDGLVRYNALDLGGVTTILVVYHDASDIVTKLALVYLERPPTLYDTVGVMAIVAVVTPEDSSCDTTTTRDSGDEIYLCRSDVLTTVFTGDRSANPGMTTEHPGDYLIAVDPLPDNYFELVIQLGTEEAATTPESVTAVASAEVESTEESNGQYAPLTDPAGLMNGAIPLNTTLSFEGAILTLQVAEFGKQFRLGEDQTLGATSLFQVRVTATDSDEHRVLFVGYNGDASTLAVGQTVTVDGSNYGIQCFDNSLGEEICQPLIAADDVR